MNPTILVATWSNGLFALSGDMRSHEAPNQSVRSLAPDGRNGCLAILDKHKLHRRTPDGTWHTLATTSDYDLSCAIAIQNDILIGTDDARLLRLDQQGTLRPLEGFDHTPGRDSWFAGSAIVNGQRLGPPLGIRSLAASANAEHLFANVHVGGIPRSLDAGISWHPTIDIHCDVHEVRCHPTDPRIVAAASAVGLCISHDAGTTWTIESAGLHAPHASAVAFFGDNIFLSTSVDPFSPQGKIYRRPLTQGGFLHPLGGGFPEWTAGKVDTNCIATKGSTIALVDSGGNLFLSTDFGLTWFQHAHKFPTPSSVLII